jgi:hypothetical protein
MLGKPPHDFNTTCWVSTHISRSGLKNYSNECKNKDLYATYFGKPPYLCVGLILKLYESIHK